jgi:O-antigen ligase
MFKRTGAASSRETALLGVVGGCFLAMILLGPYMTLVEVTSGRAVFTGEGNSLRQIGYVLLLGLMIYGAGQSPRGFAALKVPIPMLVMLGWCVFSVSWAVDPNISARRLILTAIVVWTTFIFVQAAGYTRFMATARVVLVAALVLNFLFVFFDPSLGTHMVAESSKSTALIGNWRGFMMHKNIAGAVCAITILMFLFDAKSVKPLLRIAIIVAAGYFLLKTQSKTSAGMLVLATALAWVFQTYDNRIRIYAVPLIMILTAVGWFLYSTYAEFVFQNYLTASSFTGRGLIWMGMLRYAGDHPMFGAGFGSFWNIGAGSPIFQYGQGFVQQISVAHNGYLDLLVTIGIPGVILAVLAAVIWPVWRLLTIPIDAKRGGLTAALLLFCMGHNITESSLFERDAPVGVFMIVAVAIVSAARRSGSLRPRASGNDIFATLAERRAR